MFVEKTTRQMASYNLDDPEDLERYNTLLNNPQVRILEKRYNTQTETMNEGESSSSVSRLYLYVVYEICSL